MAAILSRPPCVIKHKNSNILTDGKSLSEPMMALFSDSNMHRTWLFCWLVLLSVVVFKRTPGERSGEAMSRDADDGSHVGSFQCDFMIFFCRPKSLLLTKIWIMACICNLHPRKRVGCNYSCVAWLLTRSWSLGMDELWHPAFDNGCNYLSTF